MDKRTLLAIALITVMITVWMIYMSINTPPPPPPKKGEVKKTENVIKDTLNPGKSDTTLTAENTNDSLDAVYKYGISLVKFLKGNEQIITVENDLVIAKISSKGGVIKEWTLKKYKHWDKRYPLQLIWDYKGELGIKFASRETGREVDTRDLYYKFVDAKSNFYNIEGKNDSLTLTAVLELKPGKSIVRKYTFFKDKYHINTEVQFNNFEDILTNKGYNLEWNNGLRYQEHSSVEESNDAMALLQKEGTIFDIDASGFDPVKTQQTGTINFAAVKSKYFTAAIMPKPDNSYDGTVTLTGQRYGSPDNGAIEKYNMSFQESYRGGEAAKSFQVYIGPIDYDIVHEYGLQATVNLGWKWIVRPIGEFFMLPFFMLIYKIIGNFGISIIVFSIFMKIILYPLSIQQMRSAQKMQLIAPEMTSIREKYKDDNTTQQKEIMKLYSEYGINPAGGCLPLILQMPILYALWGVLRSAITLRQSPFGLWIHDLSLPDTIFTLPFSLMGITTISGLSLLMGITMFIQQKMTITDPKQKAMVYMMPIMFTLMFSNFPSGLNLYYFMFNLLSILQQTYINKFSKNKLTLADLKRMPKKPGWFAKKMAEAQEVAGKQGRSVPGQAYTNNKSKYSRGSLQKPPKKK